MKILPTMSRGVVFLHEDGKTFEMAPLHIFRTRDGDTVIRIGRNILTLDESGNFDGEECHLDGIDAAEIGEQLAEALKQSVANQGQAPESLYFSEGSAGRAAEERSREALLATAPRQARH